MTILVVIYSFRELSINSGAVPSLALSPALNSFAVLPASSKLIDYFARPCNLIHISPLTGGARPLSNRHQPNHERSVSRIYMDDAFYRDRAMQIRELAKEADPFIKKRLLHLASNYEAMTTPRARTVPSNRPNDSADTSTGTGRGRRE